MWSWKSLLVFLAFATVLGSIAFFFNALNENNLISQSLQKAWLNFASQKPTIKTNSLKSELSLSVELPEPSPSISTQTATKEYSNPDPYAYDKDLQGVPWGQAVQVSETGWKMKVGFDEVMGTPQETFQALNHYRYTKGKSNLTWDDRLAKYALERATYICQNGSDSHEGFSRYVSEEEGYKTLGFYHLGENMSTHMRLTGVHLIEWMYASDPDHDGNQLGDWSHVGVGIYEDCSALIFGNLMI